jgi:hypothetical protein
VAVGGGGEGWGAESIMACGVAIQITSDNWERNPSLGPKGDVMVCDALGVGVVAPPATIAGAVAAAMTI